MAILGFGDLRDTALPSLIDLAELKKIELADGTTFDQVANEIRVGMQALNAELLAMPHYGGLFPYKIPSKSNILSERQTGSKSRRNTAQAIRSAAQRPDIRFRFFHIGAYWAGRS